MSAVLFDSSSNQLEEELGPMADGGVDRAVLLQHDALHEQLLCRAPSRTTPVLGGLDTDLLARVRHAIGTAITRQIQHGFQRWYDSYPDDLRPTEAPFMSHRQASVAHDPTRIPPVAQTIVEISAGDQPSADLTYRAKDHWAPCWQMRVTPAWGADIAAAGWAVIACYQECVRRPGAARSPHRRNGGGGLPGQEVRSSVRRVMPSEAVPTVMVITA
ncbi:hypothetical protein [Streptomyces sp. NPDC005408]|uniref:hypothetical protein n=1 Tax=Streptomyces sp. NPDC005408 TaxID=3155341 RepID=UPI0033BF556E